VSGREGREKGAPPFAGGRNLYALRFQRYILRQLVRNFLFLLVVVTALIFLAAMGQNVRRYADIPLTQLVWRFPYLLPAVFKIAVPLALLVATLLTYGRLSSDNEVLAIRMGGIHLVHAALPGILLGAMLSVAMLFLSGSVAPRSSLKARQVTKDDLRKLLKSLEAQRVSKFSTKGIEMSWREVDEEGWLRGFFFEIRPQGGVEVRGEAERAKISRNERAGELDFLFRDVTIVVGDMSTRITAPEKHLTYPVEALFGSSNKKTRRELYTNQEILKVLHRNPRLGQVAESRDLAKFRVVYWDRVAMSLSCIVFALVGIPMGILIRRGSFLLSSFLALLLAFVVYYPLREVGQGLAERGVISAGPALFMPGALLAAIGLELFRRVFSR